MGKAKRKDSEAYEEIDEILSEITSVDDEDEDQPEEQEPEPEESEEPVADEEEPAPDDGDSYEDDSGDEEPEPLAADAETTDEDVEAEEPSKKETPDDLKAAGLLREVTELRRKLADAKAQAAAVNAQPQPPPQRPIAPAPEQTTAPGLEQGRVPILLSEDGETLYADPEAQQRSVEGVASEVVQRQLQQFENERRRVEIVRATQQFIDADPEVNRTVADRVHIADEFLSSSINRLAERRIAETGYGFSSLDEVIGAVHDSGLDKQVESAFPEIAPILDDFIQAQASGEPQYRLAVLDHLAKARRPQQAPRVASPVRDVSKMPSSMSRKGGSRSQSPSSDEAEFSSLNSKMQADVFTFLSNDEAYNRLQELGKKLGKPGYE